MDVWVPRYQSPERPYGMIPPSPPSERRERLHRLCRQIVDREMRTYTGRILCPGMRGYDETVQAIGVSAFYPGLAQVRRETTKSGGSGGGSGPSVTPNAFWRLEDANDSVGSLNFTNTSVTFSTGKIGNAAYFNGSANLQVASATAVTMGAFPCCFWGWAYFDANTGTQNICSKWLFSASREYFIGLASGVINWQVTNDGATGHNCASSVSISAATWYFWSVRYNTTANQLQISVNGGTWDTLSYSSGIFVGSANFAIGCQLNGTTPFNKLTGRVDALAVFRNQSVADADVTAGYNGGSGTEYYSGAWH